MNNIVCYFNVIGTVIENHRVLLIITLLADVYNSVSIFAFFRYH